MRSFRVLLVGLFGAALLAPVGASAGQHLGFDSDAWSAEGPSAHGWHRDTVHVSLWMTGPEDQALDSCATVVSNWIPPGVQVSGLAPIVDPTVATCRIDTTVTFRSTVETVRLAATAGDWQGSSSIEVRVDGVEPSVVIDQPPLPVQALGVMLAGRVADDLSGPLDVRVRFRDTLGLYQPIVVDADCPDCGTFIPCHHARQPVCGAEHAWSLTTFLPPGQWIATPIARDLATNEAEGDWVHILAV